MRLSTVKCETGECETVERETVGGIVRNTVPYTKSTLKFCSCIPAALHEGKCGGRGVLVVGNTVLCRTVRSTKSTF